MDGISMVWYMAGGAMALMGLVHLLIAYRREDQRHAMLFGIAALAGAAYAVCELGTMRSTSAVEFARWVRWGSTLSSVFFIAMALYIHRLFGTGRRWLLWLFVAGRGLVMLINVSADVSVNYLHVAGVEWIVLWGQEISWPVGAVINPWTRLASLTFFLFILYVLDASRSLWRLGDARSCRRAVWVGAGLAVPMSGIALGVFLRHEGLLHWPYVGTPAFLVALSATAYELAKEMLRASDLARTAAAGEAQLRVTEQRMALAMSAGGVGVWEWHVGNGAVWLSRQARELLGVDAGDGLSPHAMLDRAEPEERDGVWRAVERVAAQGGEFDLGLRIRASGEDRWLALRGGVVQDSNSGGTIVRGAVIDVTHQRETEQRFRAITEALPNVVLMIDAAGRIVLANSRCKDLLGYEAAELVGRPFESVVPAGLGLPSESAAGEASGDGAVRHSSDVVGVRKDGVEILLEVWLAPVQTREGERVIANLVDLSLRRAADREIAEQRLELTHLSRVAMLGELSGSLAHELNQPLAAILSNAQSLEYLAENGRLEPAELREVLRDIVDDTKRAGEVIRRLRALLVRQRSDPEVVDLNETIDDVLRLVRSDLIGRGVSVSVDAAPDLPAVRADRVQVQQVLINLIFNACEAMETMTSRRSILLRTGCENENPCVYVSDSGAGISASDPDRIFAPFVTTKPNGMGLGLAVCRTIIEHHGGRIGAYNNAYGGATFYFTLPRTVQAGA